MAYDDESRRKFRSLVSGPTAQESQAARQSDYGKKIFSPVDAANRYQPTASGGGKGSLGAALRERLPQIMARKQQEADAETLKSSTMSREVDQRPIIQGMENQGRIEAERTSGVFGLARERLGNQGRLAEAGVAGQNELARQRLGNQGALDVAGLNAGVAAADREQRANTDRLNVVGNLIQSGASRETIGEIGRNANSPWMTDYNKVSPVQGKPVTPDMKYVSPEDDPNGKGFFYDATNPNPVSGQPQQQQTISAQDPAAATRQASLDATADKYSKIADERARAGAAMKAAFEPVTAEKQAKPARRSTESRPLAVPTPEQEGARSLSEAQQLQEDLRMSREARRKKELIATQRKIQEDMRRRRDQR